MHRLLARLSAPLLLCAAATPLAIRHDVDEARYVEFGKTFPAVVWVGGLGSGTLVGSDWVLTAAHVPEMLQRMRRGQPLGVVVAGEEYEVAEVVLPEERTLEPTRHDIALLRLAKPVAAAIAPLPLWESDVEPGTEIAIAGFGILAQGEEGLKMSPKVMALPTRELRAGWNKVERVDAHEGLLIARFDDPDSALELEANPCIGDSGGPGLVRVEGEDGAPASWHVAGVIANIDDTDDDGIVGEYGEEFGLTFVAAYAEWIRETTGE